MRNPVARENRTQWIKTGIWLMVFVLLACAGSSIASTAARILPQAREYKISSSAQEGFTVQEALQNEEALAQAGITVFSSQKGKLTGENGVELSVTRKATDDRYADVYRLSLLRGTYFVSNGIESMDHFAVISDKTALALFKSLDAVGQEVNIDKTRYTVIGVYEHHRSLLCDLSSDGSDTVLVPLSSQASVMQEMPVNLTVPLQGNDGLQESIGAVQQILGGKTAAYQTEDLTQATQVMEQNMQILWFVVGVTIGILLLRMGLGFLAQFVKGIRRKGGKQSIRLSGRRARSAGWLLEPDCLLLPGLFGAWYPFLPIFRRSICLRTIFLIWHIIGSNFSILYKRATQVSPAMTFMETLPFLAL